MVKAIFFAQLLIYVEHKVKSTDSGSKVLEVLYAEGALSGVQRPICELNVVNISVHQPMPHL